MSHGRRAAALSNARKEWWGRRYFSMHTKGGRWTWWWKRATHKRERRDARLEVQRLLAEEQQAFREELRALERELQALFDDEAAA